MTSVTPEWIPALASPVRDGHADLVAPRYPRAVADAPLVTQLVRPLVRAAYGWTLSEPLMGEFGCSRRVRRRIASRFRCWASAHPPTAWTCGWRPRRWRAASARRRPRSDRVCSAPARKRPALPDVFQQVMEAVCACLEQHDGYWLARETTEPVPCFGTLTGAVDLGPRPDVTGMAEAFARDVAALHPVLATILSEPTLAGVILAAARPSRLRRTTTTCGRRRCSSSCSRITGR